MSQIRPENRGRYPSDWPAITARIKTERAAGRCECSGECGRPADHIAADGRCHNRHGQPAHGTGSRVVLTTAHLDHTPENSDDDNLRAMCQGCHLHYDRGHHATTRSRTIEAAREAAGQMVLHIGSVAAIPAHLRAGYTAPDVLDGQAVLDL